ncbi:aspartokinase domain-containing protein, partial [mine drainage metagenome]
MAPSRRLEPVLSALPSELRQGVWPRLTVTGIDLESVAPDTPGIIATLDDLLARVGLVPRLMVGAGNEFRWVGADGPARRVGEAIRAGVAAGAEAAKVAARYGSPRGMATDEGAQGTPSAAEVARSYIDRHPSVADCLAYGVVNVTLLARRISEENQDPRVDALEMAIRRYPVRSDPADTLEHRLLEVVAASRVEVRTRVALVSIPPSTELLRTILSREAMEARSQRRLFQILQGPAQVTILCESEYVPQLRSLAQSRREVAVIWDGLTAITVESPREVYETPGVVAYLAGTLFRHRINCVELMS